MKQRVHLEVWQGAQRLGHVHLSPGVPLEVGREGSGCRIADPTMSRRHFRVTQGDGGVYVDDLGSSGGTFLNDNPVIGAQLLSQGDRIEAGETIFIVDIETQLPSHIEGTRWRIAAVPAGFFVIRHLGLQCEGSSSFAETVVCKEDELGDAASLDEYADRQVERLGLFAADLRVMPTVALAADSAGLEAVARRLSFTYQGKPLHQWHVYVGSAERVGILVWTFEHAHDAEARRLADIRSGVVYDA